MKLNYIKSRAKKSLEFLSSSNLTTNQKIAVNTLIDMFDAFEIVLDSQPKSKIIDVLLLKLFLAEYIKTENPELSMSEVMQDVSDSFDLDYHLQFAKLDVCHQIQSNQNGLPDDVYTFLPLVDEVLTKMKEQIEWKK